jgi:hypothetical protein
MPNSRKRTIKTRRINLESERGRGLIPASDNIENERHARTKLTLRIIATVKPYLGSAKRVSDDLAIANILANLRHYCDLKGMAFGKIQKAARQFYFEERAFEATCLIRPIDVDEVG